MPTFPTSTGNFVMRKNSRDNFDFFLLTNGSAINLTGTAVTMVFKHNQVASAVNSFPTGATSPRLSILNTTSGAVRLQTLSGDFTQAGKYEHYFVVWDSSSNMSYVPEHLNYTLELLDVF